MAKKRTKKKVTKRKVHKKVAKRGKTNPSARHKKYIGVIGDRNPIEHWGGIIYDAGYGPQMTYFQSYDGDEEYMVSVYTFDIEDNVLADLNWVDWNSVADSIGMDVQELKEHAVSDNVFARASVYESVAGHYGFSNLDSYPQEMTLKAAEGQFGRAVDAAHRAESKARAKNPARSNPKLKWTKFTPKNRQPYWSGRPGNFRITKLGFGHGYSVNAGELRLGVVPTLPEAKKMGEGHRGPSTNPGKGAKKATKKRTKNPGKRVTNVRSLVSRALK